MAKFYNSSATSFLRVGFELGTRSSTVLGVNAISFVDYNTTVNFGNLVLDDTRNNSEHITHRSVENLSVNTVSVSIFTSGMFQEKYKRYPEREYFKKR